MEKWVIIRLMTGTISMVSADGSGFTESVSNAAIFSTEEEAQALASTIKTPLLVQRLTPDILAAPKVNFPVPDYFEASPKDTMSLLELVDRIRSDNLIEYFTPVEKISGANQMSGGGLSDPITGRLIGRFYQFSFDRVMNDSDVCELHTTVSQTNAWSSVNYQRKQLGFTEYAVLTLQVKMC